MNTHKHFFTSESVGEGHPDKLCDQISDSVLDKILSEDKNPEHARVACETYVTMGLLIVGGEITTNAYVDIQKMAREIIKGIGYTRPEYVFDFCAVMPLKSLSARDADGLTLIVAVRAFGRAIF